MKRAALAAVVVLFSTASAFGYVRSRTDKGVPVFWPSDCVYIQPDSAGTPDIPADQVFATVQKAIANWQNVTAGAAYLKFMYDAPAPLEAHLDGVNTVKFRTDRWCHPNDAQQTNVCYSSAAAGITTVFYVPDGHSNTGTIIDADIELNDINFTFAILPSSTPARPGTTIADLENTLTHELGHVQGLDHTCKDQATPPQEVDDTGNPPPDCATLYLLPPDEQTKIKTATMYNFAAPMETTKRTPEADDVAGIAAAYPPPNDPMQCKRSDPNAYKSGSGCSIGGPPRSVAALSLLSLALVMLVARRRR